MHTTLLFSCKNKLAGLGQKVNRQSWVYFCRQPSLKNSLALDLHLTQNSCDLVVVDSFGDIFQGTDSNSTTQMRKNVRSFDYFAKKHKCLILFVHHINKASYTETPHQKNIMGGGGLTQKVRFAWQLTSGEGSTKYLTVVKGTIARVSSKKTHWCLLSAKMISFSPTPVIKHKPLQSILPVLKKAETSNSISSLNWLMNFLITKQSPTKPFANDMPE